MKCEVTLFLNYLKNKYDLKSTTISDSIETLTNKIINDSLQPSKDFKFHKSKR